MKDIVAIFIGVVIVLWVLSPRRNKFWYFVLGGIWRRR